MGRQLDRDRYSPLKHAVIALMAFAAAGAAHAQGGASAMPADLARALDTYHRATVGKDIATLSGLVTDDYMLLNSDATVQRKQSYLADFRVPGFAIQPYLVQHPTFRDLGGAALTGGEMDLSWAQDGERQQRHLRFTHIWVRHAGHWQIAYSQLTRAPRPPTPQ